MGPRSRRFTVLWIVSSLAVLPGCGSQSRSTYPVLEQTVESDEELDCAGFDDELLKANAIRDAIFEERGDVLSDDYLATAGNVASDPISGILLGVITGLSTSKANTTYLEAATAAGLRMEQMLEYKDRRDCPSGPTGDSSLTDSTALNKLHDLESQLRQEEITQKQYLAKRRTLLDSLR